MDDEPLSIETLKTQIEHMRAVQEALAAGLAFYARKPIAVVLKAAEDAVSEREAGRG